MPTRAAVEKLAKDVRETKAQEQDLRNRLDGIEGQNKAVDEKLAADNKTVDAGSGTDTEKATKKASNQNAAAQQKKELNKQAAAVKGAIDSLRSTRGQQESKLKDAQADLAAQDAQTDDARAKAGREAPEPSRFARDTDCTSCKSLAKQGLDAQDTYDRTAAQYEELRKKLRLLAGQIDGNREILAQYREDLQRALNALNAANQILEERGPLSDLNRNIEDYRRERDRLISQIQTKVKALNKLTQEMTQTDEDLDRLLQRLKVMVLTIHDLVNKLDECEKAHCPLGVAAQQSSETKESKTTATQEEAPVGTDDNPTGPTPRDVGVPPPAPPVPTPSTSQPINIVDIFPAPTTPIAVPQEGEPGETTPPEDTVDLPETLTFNVPFGTIVDPGSLTVTTNTGTGEVSAGDGDSN